ncbi:ribosome protection-type tetracycline resistance related proteins, group 2 [Lentilactobacillus kosonis]|uniref:Ribosome protection-type tetracycline resistance related proteins, group 2 n=1 Tax=Lentilactobacillus kosonis TaxID=2810561 RepID=A0A401FIK7_9LACO|nr:ribosome protection-type tetracycline resistance related proteins, group 2 [Lentilactobacillus kosonis]
MKKIVAGIVAHVDAGKTTLSEALLYKTGALKTLGRVDNGDAFLDPDALEKARGITIFRIKLIWNITIYRLLC